MAKWSARDPRFTRLKKMCRALPEVSCDLCGDHAGFRVRRRTFGYFLNNHHGDGVVGLACKVLPGDNTALVAAQPERFYLPAYMASRGWVALRLDGGEIDWDEVWELLACSYRLIAPQKLAALVEAGS